MTPVTMWVARPALSATAPPTMIASSNALLPGPVSAQRQMTPALTPTGSALRGRRLTCNNSSECETDESVTTDAVTSLCQYVPRTTITDNEKVPAARDQYSTCMDYAQSLQLGRPVHDYAAIMFGYTQLVETYADTSKVYERVQRASDLTGLPIEQWLYLNTDHWPNRGMGFFIPSSTSRPTSALRKTRSVFRGCEQVQYQKEWLQTTSESGRH